MAPPPNGMHELLEQLETLEQTANLSASIHHVQNAIDLLTAARAKIANGAHAYRMFRMEQG
jgi:hypothetical protein